MRLPDVRCLNCEFKARRAVKVMRNFSTDAFSRFQTVLTRICRHVTASWGKLRDGGNTEALLNQIKLELSLMILSRR